MWDKTDIIWGYCWLTEDGWKLELSALQWLESGRENYFGEVWRIIHVQRARKIWQLLTFLSLLCISQPGFLSLFLFYSLPWLFFYLVPFQYLLFKRIFSPALGVRLESLNLFPLLKCKYTPDYTAMMDFNYLSFFLKPWSKCDCCWCGRSYVGRPALENRPLSVVRCLLFMLWIPWARLVFRNELCLSTMEKCLLPKLGWVSHCDFQK